MQILQPILGTNVHPLGQKVSLCNPNRLLLKPSPKFLHGESGVLRKIAAYSPLVNYSKFLLSRIDKAPIEPLIGWDTWDTTRNLDAESSSIEFESFHSIPEENKEHDIGLEREAGSVNVLTSNIDNNINDEVDLNIKQKSKSNKPNKNPKKSQFKSPSSTESKKSQSKSTKSKSPSSTESKKSQSKSRNKQSLNKSEESLQQHSNSDSTANDSHSIINTPIPAVAALPNLEDKPILFRNLANHEPQVIPELPSGLPSGELPTTANSADVLENNVRSQHGTILYNTTSESTQSSPIAPLSTHYPNLLNGEILYSVDSPTSPIPEPEEHQTPIPPPQAAGESYTDGSFETNIAETPESRNTASESPVSASISTSKSDLSCIGTHPTLDSPSKTSPPTTTFSPDTTPFRLESTPNNSPPTTDTTSVRLESTPDNSPPNTTFSPDTTSVRLESTPDNSPPTTDTTSVRLESTPDNSPPNTTFSRDTISVRLESILDDSPPNTTFSPDTTSVRLESTPDNSPPNTTFSPDTTAFRLESTPDNSPPTTTLLPDTTAFRLESTLENSSPTTDTTAFGLESTLDNSPPTTTLLPDTTSVRLESTPENSSPTTDTTSVRLESTPDNSPPTTTLLPDTTAFRLESTLDDSPPNTTFSPDTTSVRLESTPDNSPPTTTLLPDTTPFRLESTLENSSPTTDTTAFGLESTLDNSPPTTTLLPDTTSVRLESTPENSPPTTTLSPDNSPPTTTLSLDTTPLRLESTLDDSSPNTTLSPDTTAFRLESTPENSSPTSDTTAFGLESTLDNSPPTTTLLPDTTAFRLESTPENSSPNTDTTAFGLESTPENFPPTATLSLDTTPLRLESTPENSPPTTTLSSDTTAFRLESTPENSSPTTDTTAFGLESTPDNSPPNRTLSPDTTAFSLESTPDNSSPNTILSPDTTAFSLESTPDNSSPNTILSPDTTPNVGETPTVFSNLVSDERQVISNLPPYETNTVLLTTINNSDTVENTTPAQNKEDTSPKTDFDSFPAPQGFAIGGHVTTAETENPQQIAPSDTVPAMLTPGEFVINARDAQKHLNLLKHINTGGTASDIVLPSLQTSNGKDQQQTTSVESPTKVDSLPETSLQRTKSDIISPQVSHSLSSSSLGLEIQKQRRSILSSPEINTFDATTTLSNVGQSSNQYSSPSLIFRQKNPSPSTHTPSQWSSVEELLNGSTDDFTVFNPSGVEFTPQKSAFSHVEKSPSESRQIFAKRLPQPQGFADGGEVTKIDATIQPITETIQRRLPTSSSEDDNADLEVLAHEIYHRLRQRLEIERERYGVHSGRLPW